MSDVRLLEDLEEGASSDLWPAWPETLPLMERWLERVENLLSRPERHEATLAGLRSAAKPYTDAKKIEDRKRHPRLSELVLS